MGVMTGASAPWSHHPMTIGPVEYIIIGFPGNQFNGEVAPALADLIASGMIKVLDLVFISKDSAGDVLFGDLDGDVGGIIGPDDIEHAAEALEPNSSAALLIWEDTWAIPFVDAVRQSGGILLEGGRIPHDIIEPALTELS